ncbi:3-oxoacyl-[acyl-carrier-protein] reductase FabG [Cladophialophora carrionii]|uniref:3-oxoacyl-[acyl-carrier-protein] reductase FabG n=1 Tax=Cladophialophora carrionii TaxID=86049 RepID=A0A1C1CQF3_9EURO|nr:3-oxoacyl-[acyl-carrier-protein] reductase FabG [Cladophialophora carrionii]
MSSPRFSNKLAGKRVLLVGGTGGVGMSVAQALIEFGASIILSSSREAKVREVCAQLIGTYPEARDRVSGYACDLASPSVEANIEELFTKVGEIDHIVYMAGDRLPMIPLEDVTLEKWQKCNQVRTIAAILVVKIGTKYMKKDRHSSVVLTGGSISEKPIAGGWSMLALIGAGLNGLARQLAFDLAPIRVNCVAPGVIETDLWQGMGEEGKRAFFASHESKIPTGKVGQPEDLAEAYLYCLKDANATGIVVHSNSGTFLM